MATLEQKTLPEDFVDQVQRHIGPNGLRPGEDIHAAVLAVPGRPLTDDEVWAIIDSAAANSRMVRWDQGIVDRVTKGGQL